MDPCPPCKYLSALQVSRAVTAVAVVIAAVTNESGAVVSITAAFVAAAANTGPLS